MDQIALLSLAFRQTNVVWLVFTAGISAVDILGVNKKSDDHSQVLYNPLAIRVTSIGTA